MNEFVVIKLVTGEQILAALGMEFEDSIIVSFPITLKSVPFMKDGGLIERLATSEFCPFTDDKEFNIQRKDIVFIKPMKKAVAVMYQRTLEDMYIMPSYDSEESQLDDHEDTEEQETLKKNYH